MATPTPAPAPTPLPEGPEAAAPPQDLSDPVQFYEAVIPTRDGEAPDTSRGLAGPSPRAPAPRAAPAEAPAPSKAAPTPRPATAAPAPRPATPGAPTLPLDLRGYLWSPTGDAILVEDRQDLVLVDLARAQARRLTSSPERRERTPRFSPSGDGLVYHAAGHLYWMDLPSGQARRLSPSGPPGRIQGAVDATYAALYAPRTPQGFEISPDGRTIAFLTLDPPTDDEGEPILRPPHPGDALPTPGLTVVDRQGRALWSFTLPEAGYILPALRFTDGGQLAYMTLDRAQDTLRLFVVDPGEGAPRLVLEETMPHFYPPPEPPYFLPDGERFIWMSPYYGFHQPHLGDITKGDRRPKRLLKDPWNLDFLGLGDRGRWMYLQGSGEVPTERYLYRMHPTGGGLTRLTLRWGWHDVTVSPDGEAFVDTFSDPDAPPVTSLWVDRERAGVLEDRRADLKGTIPGSRQILRFPAEDGQQLFGDLRLPEGDGPAPVALRLSSGPGSQSVGKAYLPDPLTLALLRSGYGVFTVDTRGSGGRMHRFTTAIDGQPGGAAEQADIRAAWDRLGQESGVDMGRVILLGEGYGALKALKAYEGGLPARGLVAIAPLTDLGSALAPLGERFLGTPADNPSGYAAAKVDGPGVAREGPVLIVVGSEATAPPPDQGARLLKETLGSARPPRLVWIPGAGDDLLTDPEAGPYALGQILDFMGSLLN